jgi:hypothetical protein
MDPQPPPTNPASTPQRSSRRGYRRRTISQNKAHSSSHKKSPNHTTLPLSIGFPIPRSLPTSWVLSTATKVLVDHLLYARGLIPLSVLQLNQQYENDILNSPSVRRKVSQCRSRLESWNREWNAVDDNLFAHCSFILISLGPSFSRPRESYVLNAANLQFTNTIDSPKLPSPHALAQRLLPRILECDSALPSRVAPSYQVWVSMYVKQEAFEQLWTSETNQTLGWVRRTGFQLPTANNIKANQRVVEIQLTNVGSQETADTSRVTEEPNGYWISVPTSIKGFRI